MISENGTQKLLLTEEGYINLAGTQQYHYYLKDHQGNNRVAVSYTHLPLEAAVVLKVWANEKSEEYQVLYSHKSHFVKIGRAHV